MSPSRKILLTGPVNGIDAYAASARDVGWDPVFFPLFEIEPRMPQGPAAAAVDWIALTSSNALPYLAALADATPALRDVPAAVVGERSAARLRELGFTLGIEPARDADALADALCARAATGARALWLRGPISDAFGERLRAAGWDVATTIAYDQRRIERGSELPEAAAIFFASPSAVRAFGELELGSGSPPVAIAIGATTFSALLAAPELLFPEAVSLPNPSPSGLALALEHIDSGA